MLLEAKKAGLGAEAASMGEMQHALNIGFDPAKEGFNWPLWLYHHLIGWRYVFNFENLQKIVYDSPVKTSYDLEHAIKAGVHINLAWFSYY